MSTKPFEERLARNIARVLHCSVECEKEVHELAYAGGNRILVISPEGNRYWVEVKAE